MQHDVIGIGTASYCYLCPENFTSSTLMHAILTALNQIKFVQQLQHRVISIQLLLSYGQNIYLRVLRLRNSAERVSYGAQAP